MTLFFSGLADTTRRLAVSGLVLLCFVWPNINHSHTYLWLLATLVVIGFHIVLEGYHTCTCAKCEMDIHIHWPRLICSCLPRRNPELTTASQSRDIITNYKCILCFLQKVGEQRVDICAIPMTPNGLRRGVIHGLRSAISYRLLEGCYRYKYRPGTSFRNIYLR